jgi:hypothetical protein
VAQYGCLVCADFTGSGYLKTSDAEAERNWTIVNRNQDQGGRLTGFFLALDLGMARGMIRHYSLILSAT